MSLIQKARYFAISHHKDQKYGMHPYMYHLDNVAYVCKECWPIDEKCIAVAWLHDVIENTEATFEMVKESFGQEVAENVLALTSQKDKRRTFETIARNTISRRVKLADRFCNMQECIGSKRTRNIKKYFDEYPLFKECMYNEKEQIFWATQLEPLFDFLKKEMEND